MKENKLILLTWEEEKTICYQIYVNGIYITRRQDNDMINVTKLLNLINISKGKKNVILKNIKEKAIIKRGINSLKGIWISFYDAKLLVMKYNIENLTYPLFIDEPFDILF